MRCADSLSGGYPNQILALVTTKNLFSVCVVEDIRYFCLNSKLKYFYYNPKATKNITM